MLQADDANDILNKLLDSFFENYEKEGNILRNGSNYTFEYVDIKTKKFHTIDLKRGSSYIPSPKWTSDKKATINPKNLKDNICFAYAIVATLHHEEIGKNPHRLSNFTPYIDNYNWKDIQFPPTKKDWTAFEKNNTDIALNILPASSTEKKIHTIRRSEYNNTRIKQVHLLMIIDNNNNWHYITIKSISRLFRGVTSKSNSDFYCLNCLHSFRTRNKLLSHEKFCNNHSHREIIMPTEDNNIIEYKSNDKAIHHPHIVYADIETIFKETDSCKPNTSNSYTEKNNTHMPCGYALYLVRTYENNLISSHRGTDCIQKFVRALKIMVKMIIDTPKKPIAPLTDDENRKHERSKYCHICLEPFSYDKENEKYNNYRKVKDHCHYTGKYRGAAHNKCNLKYKVPKDIPVVFHNGSKYGFHFIINEMSKGIHGIQCLGEDAEKYITFKVPMKKEIKDGKFITFKLKFIDSIRFMNTSLSKLTDNLVMKNKCNEEYNYYKRKNKTRIYKCKQCNKKTCKSIDSLKEKFSNVYFMCNNNIDKFLLLLRKGVYPYEYMNSWNRSNETSLPSKKEFYNKLNQEDITDDDYRHARKVWTTFNIKNLGEYHDLYVQADTLQLADIFGNFRNTCQVNYQLDPAHFLSAPGLAWQACLKKTKVKIELLTDLNVLLMIEQGIRGGIYIDMQHQITNT